MLDQILETYRRAAESTLQFQQELLRNWTGQWPQPWPPMPLGMPNPATSWLEQIHAAQRKWADTVGDLLNRHRTSLDAQYKAGIRTIEDAFRVGQARDPEHFRRLTEELWRQSFDCLKTVAEAQARDFQDALRTWFEATSKAAAALKP